MAKRKYDSFIMGFLHGRDGQETPFKVFHKETENHFGEKIWGPALGRIVKRIFRESKGLLYLNSDRLKK